MDYFFDLLSINSKIVCFFVLINVSSSVGLSLFFILRGELCANQVAFLLFDSLLRLYRVHFSVLFDRDVYFTAKFWYICGVCLVIR